MLNATDLRLKKEVNGEVVRLTHSHALGHEFEVALNKVLGWGWSLNQYVEYVCHKSSRLAKKMAAL